MSRRSTIRERFRATRMTDVFVLVRPVKAPHVLVLGLALLVIYTGLRIALAARCPIQLYQPEEYVHLRLFRQIQAGLPLGALSEYMYGKGSGFDGGGSLVQSILYLPLGPIVGTGHAAVKTMALMWALLGACLSAALARRLFGEWGGTMALLAHLAVPPAFLVFSMIAWGTHTEGAVLMLLLFWVYLTAVGPPLATASRARSFLLGSLFALVPWFSPLALLPSLLLAVSVPYAFRGRLARHLPWIVAGVAVGAVPAVLLDLPGGHGTIGSELAKAAALTSERVREAGGSFPFLVEALGRVATYGVTWPGHWSPPGRLATVLHVLCHTCGWLGLVALLLKALFPTGLPTRRRSDASPLSAPLEVSAAGRAVLLTVALTALGLPVALHALDLADTRRLTPVYSLWALGWAFALLSLWRIHGRMRVPARVAVLGLPLLAMVPSVLLIASGHPPDGPFRSSSFALEPKGEPVEEWWIAIFDVTRPSLPMLDELVDDPRLVSRSHRGAALRGYSVGSARGRDPLVLKEGYCPLHIPPEFVQRWRWDEDARPFAWEYFGAGLAVGCTRMEVSRGCESAGDDTLRAACLRGSARTADLLAAHPHR